jgi:hypothetical protein
MAKNTSLSTNDRVIVHLIYARDCIHSGKLAKADQSISAVLALLSRDNQDSIDSEVIRLLKGAHQ